MANANVITKVRISDDFNEQAEVLVYKVFNIDRDIMKVKLDLNPDDESYPSTYMLYTPDQARQLAVYLMEAAHLADKGVNPDWYNPHINHTNGS